MITRKAWKTLAGKDPTEIGWGYELDMRWDSFDGVTLTPRPAGGGNAYVELVCPHEHWREYARFRDLLSEDALIAAIGPLALAHFLERTQRPGGCGCGLWMAHVGTRLLAEADAATPVAAAVPPPAPAAATAAQTRTAAPVRPR